MQKHDRRALTRALALCRDESVGRAEQIDSKLQDEAWEDVAAFAAGHCQIDALKLYPWQQPPADVDEDDDGDNINADAVALLRKMLAAGLSRYEPDPLTALAAAAKRKGAA